MGTHNFTTYNLHGYNQDSRLLNDLRERFDIIAIQEHWICDFDANFNDLFMVFHGQRCLTKLVLIGRPYGGIGLLVYRSLNVSVSTAEVHHLCRCVVGLNVVTFFLVVWTACCWSFFTSARQNSAMLTLKPNLQTVWVLSCLIGDFSFNCDVNCRLMLLLSPTT